MFLQLWPQEAIIFYYDIIPVKFYVTLAIKLVKIHISINISAIHYEEHQLTCDLNASESIPEPSELEPKYFHF